MSLPSSLPCKPAHLARRARPVKLSKKILPPVTSSPVASGVPKEAPRSPSPDIAGGSQQIEATNLLDILEALPKFNANVSKESYWGPEDLTLDQLIDLEDSKNDGNGANVNVKKFNPLKRKRGKRHAGPTQAAQIRRGLERRIARKVKKAKDNVVKFQTYNFSEATTVSKSAAYSKQVTQEPPRHWSDGAPRSAMSFDGEYVVFHIPGLFAEKSRNLLYDVLMELGQNVKLEVGTGADGSGRNCADSYVYHDEELVGLVKLVSAWHGIGHTNDDAVISRDYVRTGSQFRHTTAATDQLALFSHNINAVLQNIDPMQFRALETLMEKVREKYPHARALAAIDPLQMEGRAIMFNRKTPLHPDRQDPHRSWALLVTLGKCHGGKLFIPRLNLRLRYDPGDLIAVRGRPLPHEVEAWSGGQRISLAHFTHQSLWDEFGLSCP